METRKNINFPSLNLKLVLLLSHIVGSCFLNEIILLVYVIVSLIFFFLAHDPISEAPGVEQTRISLLNKLLGNYKQLECADMS